MLKKNSCVNVEILKKLLHRAEGSYMRAMRSKDGKLLNRADERLGLVHKLRDTIQLAEKVWG